MKKIFLLVCLVITAIQLFGQTNYFFQAIPESAVRLTQPLFRGTFPNAYETYSLDYQSLKTTLQLAPMEFTPAANVATCVISVPLPGGGTEAFSVWETAMLDPELAASAPYIKTYAGRSLRNGAFGIRCSYTARGFRAMLMYPDLSCAFIEPYSWNQEQFFLVYSQRDEASTPLQQLERRWIPGNAGTTDTPVSEQPFTPAVEERGTVLDPVRMKVYRYVVATTGEFAQDHGGTKPLVLSALTEYSNMVSGFFERDIDLRLQLINGTGNVVFLNPNTDPYSGEEVGNWLDQNTGVLGQYVGAVAYDVGHVYARYITGGAIGVAGGITCTDGKGRGCSAGNGAGNYGNFFLNVVGQEVGHQMSGGHSWNRCDGGGGRAGFTAFEPGSGSTIMSYAGACGPDNIQGYSDLYYHAGSIEEIKNFYTFNAGTACGTFLTTTNNAPTVTLPYQDNFFIPISTPFELTGNATDPDGDPLVYNWEEIDAGPETPLGSPEANTAIFRTLPAVTFTNRYFPRLSTVLANGFSAAEQLPTYTRDLTFRLAARDNRTGGGGVGWADVAFKSWAGAGPFTVQSPNTAAISWKSGEYANVTWDVSNTDKAPVNCKLVNIRLSTDGGQTYPIVLASGVENDGSQYVLVPDNQTNSARVRVDAADNVFYDISNTNFKIVSPTQPSFTFGLSKDYAKICLPNVFTADILSAGVLGFNTPVQLSLEGNLPAGASASFSTNTIQPGEQTTLTIDLNNVNENGIFSVNVRAILQGSTDTLIRPISFELVRNDFSALSLQLPNDGSVNLGLVQIVRWNKALDAEIYDVEVSKSPAFDVLVGFKSGVLVDTFKIPSLLEKGNAYYWHVRPRNECGVADWSEPFFFSTYVENCSTFEANDMPKTITGGSTPTIESKISVNAGGTIADINVKKLKGYHEFLKDLNVKLISPTGTELVLFADKCANFNGAFDFALDDAALGNFACPPFNNGNAMRPQNPLSVFNGQNSTGLWTLRVKDNVVGGGGGFTAFSLEFCASATLQPPYLVNNNVLQLSPGTNAAIPTGLLLTEDANNSAKQLTYTLVTVPKYGLLDKIGVGTLKAGDHFTQEEVNNGALRFYDFGANAGPDGFRFVVSDGEGGYLAVPKFVINTMLVSTQEAAKRPLHFDLYPNPAAEEVWVNMDHLESSAMRVSVLDISGRMVLESLLPAGSDRLRLATGAFASGMYVVRVEGAQGVGVKKLVVR
ncbi:MAG: reprolysin-like metallopeptidase [Saprospiraceae bacterium]